MLHCYPTTGSIGFGATGVSGMCAFGLQGSKASDFRGFGASEYNSSQPRGMLELDIEEKAPDTNALIICHCGGGGRSALAARRVCKKWAAKMCARWPAASKPGKRREYRWRSDSRCERSISHDPRYRLRSGTKGYLTARRTAVFSRRR